MLEFLKVILAVARLTTLLVDEDGPFDIFLKIRNWFGIIDIIEENGDVYKELHVSDGNNVIYTMFAKMLTCKLCTSVWVAMGLVVLNKIKYLNIINLILSVSMGAIILMKGIE